AAQEAVSDTALGPAHQGVGASVRRNEDRRLLDGGGAYLADLQVPGLAEIAFLRSPVAHGRIRAVEVPPRHRGSVFFATDIAFAKPTRWAPRPGSNTRNIPRLRPTKSASSAISSASASHPHAPRRKTSRNPAP